MCVCEYDDVDNVWIHMLNEFLNAFPYVLADGLKHVNKTDYNDDDENETK